jgi:hypothetical protein
MENHKKIRKDSGYYGPNEYVGNNNKGVGGYA